MDLLLYSCFYFSNEGPALLGGANSSQYYLAGRSSLGLASLTTMFLPLTSLPFNSLTALSASSSLDISTNTKPLERPLNLSVIKVADSTVPTAANISCNF